MAGGNSVRVIAGGDWYLGRRWANQPDAQESSSQELLELLGQADLVTANLEVALSRRGTPVDKRFSNLHITRIGSAPGEIESIIKGLKPGHETQPYISDGDPNSITVPKSLSKHVDSLKLEGAPLVNYDDMPASKKPGKTGGPKPIGDLSVEDKTSRK